MVIVIVIHHHDQESYSIYGYVCNALVKLAAQCICLHHYKHPGNKLFPLLSRGQHQNFSSLF